MEKKVLMMCFYILVIYGVFFQSFDAVNEKRLPFSNFFCAIKFVLQQGIDVPSFILIVIKTPPD